MTFLISLQAPDGTVEYPNSAGLDKGREKAELFTGNEAEAGDEAHRRAKRWSAWYDCFIRGLAITPVNK